MQLKQEKSLISIDLTTHLLVEVINLDKIQLYEGIDITTNKITGEEHGLPPYSLGVVSPKIRLQDTVFLL